MLVHRKMLQRPKENTTGGLSEPCFTISQGFKAVSLNDPDIVDRNVPIAPYSIHLGDRCPVEEVLCLERLY